MQLDERRILLTEDELGRKVLEVAQEDYIAARLATHFVSAILFMGGNFIVNLVTRQPDAISLEGSVDAKMVDCSRA